MDKTTMINFLNELLVAVITVVVPIITRYVIVYLDAKKEQVKTTSNAVWFNETIDEAINVVKKAVDTVQQTFVDDLKKEGKFDYESQKEAMAKAMEIAEPMLNEDMKKLITVTYMDLSTWMRTQAESYINSKKG